MLATLARDNTRILRDNTKMVELSRDATKVMLNSPVARYRCLRIRVALLLPSPKSTEYTIVCDEFVAVTLDSVTHDDTDGVMLGENVVNASS